MPQYSRSLLSECTYLNFKREFFCAKSKTLTIQLRVNWLLAPSSAFAPQNLRTWVEFDNLHFTEQLQPLIRYQSSHVRIPKLDKSKQRKSTLPRRTKCFVREWHEQEFSAVPYFVVSDELFPVTQECSETVCSDHMLQLRKSIINRGEQSRFAFIFLVLMLYPSVSEWGVTTASVK